MLRHVAIEKNLNRPLLLARKFTNLQIPGVGRGFPIEVARALIGFVRADAVEVAAQANHVGFDLAHNRRQQFREARLRFDGWIDEDFARQRDARDLIQEAEWKTRGEHEAVLTLRAAPVE